MCMIFKHIFQLFSTSLIAKEEKRLELKWYEARLIQTLLVYIKIFNLSIFDKNFKNEIVNVVALPLLQKMGML
jgi:hypothetical protein